MSEQGLLGTFASHAFLQPLSERHHMLLASGARPFKFAPGEYLAREGESAEHFYLIQAGQAAVEPHPGDPDPSPLQMVGPGEVVGWSWIVAPYRWQFTVRAIEPVQGIVFDAGWLRDRCEQDHELAYCVLKQLLAVVTSRVAADRLHLTAR